jgi:hypothetical protein
LHDESPILIALFLLIQGVNPENILEADDSQRIFIFGAVLFGVIISEVS